MLYIKLDYAPAGRPYCTGLISGGTHFMWYLVGVYVKYSGTMSQTLSGTSTWSDVVDYFVNAGAPVTSSMTFSQINALPGVNIFMSNGEPCVCS